MATKAGKGTKVKGGGKAEGGKKGRKAKGGKKSGKSRAGKAEGRNGVVVAAGAGAVIEPAIGEVTPAGIPTNADAELTGKAARKAERAKAEAEAALAAEGSPGPRRWSDALRVTGGFLLADLDPRSTPAFAGDKVAGAEAMTGLQDRLSDLQERLYAESRGGGSRSLLLVIQGMDTSGKGGIMRHVVGAFDPQGVDIVSFKAPTEAEKRHPFLWRIRNGLPVAGQIGVFDRSHYEDVLIVRVHDLVPRTQWSRRYGQINRFEQSVADSGTTIVKVMLHLSPEEQKARLGERLARPDKHWKFNPGDIDERAHWPAYMDAYQEALTRCSTDVAPWYVVPADRKWYARLAVTNLVLEHLEAMDPQWPKADFDVAEQQARLAALP